MVTKRMFDNARNKKDLYVTLSDLLPLHLLKKKQLALFDTFFKSMPEQLKNKIIPYVFDSEINYSSLDYEFLNKYSRRKISTNVKDIIFGLEKLQDDAFLEDTYTDWDNEEIIVKYLNPSYLIPLNSHIINTNFFKWSKECDTLNLKYDALKPFFTEIQVEETDTLTSTREKNSNKVNKVTTDDTMIGDSSFASTDKSMHSKAGFNTDIPKPESTDKSDIENSTKSNNSNKSNRLDELNDADSETYERQNPKQIKTKRLGNIGNITNQKLLLEEFELSKINFHNTFLDDIARTISRVSHNIF